ncbi:MAG: trypsin-like peptidase domain-containing protein [Oscillospiraceae bacterium]|nr:trypsin-like peptidase domain-containing protein [Oscillospiraceae bacterium]
MYENNYNYVDVTENEEKKNSGIKKTVALILAVVIAGGASGFGGAYLHNRYFTEEAAVVDTAKTENTPALPSDTIHAETTAAEDTKTPVSALLGSSANGRELTTEEIVTKVSPSVVSIHAAFDSGNSTGTGIIMSSDGYIITNAHVVQTDKTEYVPDSNGNGGYSNPYDPYDFFGGFGGFGGFGFDDYFGGGSYQTVTEKAKEVTIILSDNETEYTAEIIGTDADSDLAVLKIDAEGLSAAEFGNSDNLPMGSRAVAIGYPMGLGLSVSEGIISGLNRELSVELTSGGSASMTLIQTDAAINPGNSGGPLINGSGQVVGITSSKLASSSVEGLGFAIPITDAMPLINDLMNQGYVSNHTPQIGITGTDITPAVTRYYGLPVDSGVMVVSVAEGSGAEAAGISEGDVIVAADGEEIKSMDDLTKIKDKKEIGESIVLTLARHNGNEDVTVVLGEAENTPPEE